jgi:transcriptional regulator with GAF, ATPase, and Fis domain
VEPGTPIRLVITGEETAVFPVSKEAILVGRDPSNDVVLNSASVSRHHARLFETAFGWQIRDLGSRNGLFIKGEKVEEAPLPVGEECRLGSYGLHFEFVVEPPPSVGEETAVFDLVPFPAQGGRAETGSVRSIPDLLQDLAAHHEADDFDRLLAKALRSFFQADGVFLFWVPEERKPRPGACCQYQASSEEQGSSVLDQGILMKALRERGAVWSPIAASGTDGAGGESRGRLLVYPLVREGRVRALLHVDWSHPETNPTSPLSFLAAWPPWATMLLESLWERRRLGALRENESRQQQNLSEAFRRQIDPGEILGESSALRGAIEAASAAAPSPYPILLLGETGAGKEIFARWIHLHSPRAGGPFLALNCSGIPAGTAESELFGHRRGAFTGADRDHAGLFEQAGGGTLFLDEIGDMPLPLQAKLLRAVQFGVIRRVGDDRERKVDVRLLAATHRDLRPSTADRSFREDLYYRLTTFEIRLPPLRDRRADVPLLAAHFLERAFKKAGTAQGFSPGALGALKEFDWPGNVRQLQSAVNHLSASARAPIIEEAEVRTLLGQGVRPLRSPGDGLGDLPMREALAGFEAEYLASALERAGGNVTEAARRSGIPRRSFYRFLERHPRLKGS